MRRKGRLVIRPVIRPVAVQLVRLQHLQRGHLVRKTQPTKLLDFPPCKNAEYTCKQRKLQQVPAECRNALASRSPFALSSTAPPSSVSDERPPICGRCVAVPCGVVRATSIVAVRRVGSKSNASAASAGRLISLCCVRLYIVRPRRPR